MIRFVFLNAILSLGHQSRGGAPCSSVNAFSANPPPIPPSNDPPPSKRFIEIADLIDDFTAPQQLPVSFVESWSTWVLDTKGVWSKIPDGASDGENAGFVSPASVDTLFQPLDLKTPQFQLAMGFHVREGVIRHIMPALDVSFEGGQHRNRGLCSVPRAYKWIEFSNGMFGNWKDFQIRAFKRKQPQQQGGENSGNDDDNESSWEEIATGPSRETIAKTIERMIFGLAQSAPDDFREGSNLVHVLMDYEEDEDINLEYPKSGYELCVVLDDRQEDIPANKLEEEAQGILHVLATATMAGSESGYLPDVYKPLYEDKSLRNPIYEKFRERRAGQQKKDEE